MFLATFGGKLGYFLYHHLVTLIFSLSSIIWLFKQLSTVQFHNKERFNLKKIIQVSCNKIRTHNLLVKSITAIPGPRPISNAYV